METKLATSRSYFRHVENSAVNSGLVICFVFTKAMAQSTALKR